MSAAGAGGGVQASVPAPGKDGQAQLQFKEQFREAYDQVGARAGSPAHADRDGAIARVIMKRLG